MTYPFLPTPDYDAAAQLLAINSVIKADAALPLSDIVDFSDFTVGDWSSAAEYQDTSGLNFLFSWTSLQGSVLTQVQSAVFKVDAIDDETPFFDEFAFTHWGSATFSSKNGDKLSITNKSLSSHKADQDWHVIDFSRNANAKYIGFKDTTLDDVTYSAQVNVKGWVANDDSQGSLIHTFSISGKNSGFSAKGNGTWTQDWGYTNTHNTTLKLGAYAYTDNENTLSLSFGGTIISKVTEDDSSTPDINERSVTSDINLRKVIATTADYKCTTAVLDVRKEIGFDFEPLPFDNYSQITTKYFDKFESVMMRGANIITITNKDGAYVDADNGADKVTGSASSDVIKGGAGKDIITGGLGADLFVYGRETAGFISSDGTGNKIILATLRDFNRDTIVDFKPGEDQIGIDARQVGWSEKYAGDSEITEILPSQFKIFAAGTTFPTIGTNAGGISSTLAINQGVTTSFSNSYLMLVLGATSSVLYIDLDASGTVFNPVALATLTGVFTATNISNNDFVLVG